MDKTILTLILWLLLLGGLFGMAMGFQKFFGGATASEYGVMGIGGGFWLLAAAIVIYIRKQVEGK